MNDKELHDVANIPRRRREGTGRTTVPNRLGLALECLMAAALLATALTGRH